MVTNGNDILIYSDGTLIAGTRSNEITANVETIEVTNVINSQWRRYITGRKEWSVTVNFLLMSGNNVTALLAAGRTYTLNISKRVSGVSTTKLTGSAIMTSCKITATRGNLVQGSFSFKGTSQLDIPEFSYVFDQLYILRGSVTYSGVTITNPIVYVTDRSVFACETEGELPNGYLYYDESTQTVKVLSTTTSENFNEIIANTASQALWNNYIEQLNADRSSDPRDTTDVNIYGYIAT